MISGLSANQGEKLLYTVVISLLGILSVMWVGLTLRDATSLFSSTVTIFILVLIGATLGLLPWSLRVSETSSTQIVLMYLLSGFVTGGVIIGIISMSLLLFFGGSVLVGLVVGAVYFQTGGSNHSLLIPMWLSLLGVYLTGIVTISREVFFVGNFLAAIVGIAATVLIVGTHQSLIRERKNHFSETSN